MAGPLTAKPLHEAQPDINGKAKGLTCTGVIYSVSEAIKRTERGENPDVPVGLRVDDLHTLLACRVLASSGLLGGRVPLVVGLREGLDRVETTKERREEPVVGRGRSREDPGSSWMVQQGSRAPRRTWQSRHIAASPE